MRCCKALSLEIPRAIIFQRLGGENMNIKYIGRTTAELEHGKVHKIETSSKTGCGATYSDNPQNWQYTNEPVTCNKNGCKN